MASTVAVQVLMALVSCCRLSRTALASCRPGGGVDVSVLTTEQSSAIEYQHLIPCEDNNERFAFRDAIISSLGDGEEGRIYNGNCGNCDCAILPPQFYKFLFCLLFLCVCSRCW